MALTLASGNNSITLNPSNGLRLTKNGANIVAMDIAAGTFSVRDMNMTLTNGANKIYLDTANELRLYKGSSIVVKLGIDDGSAQFTGRVTAASGSIGGWNISADRLSIPGGDFIAANGTGRLGLMSWTRDAATFNGNIYAANLKDQVQGGHLAGGCVTSSKIADGNVGNSKLGSEAVTGSKIAGRSISDGKLDAAVMRAITKIRNLDDIGDFKTVFSESSNSKSIAREFLGVFSRMFIVTSTSGGLREVKSTILNGIRVLHI